MTRSPLRALAGAALAAALTGTLLTSALAATVTTAGAATPRPEVGDCHALTYAESLEDSDPDAPISCERSHTSRTIKVQDVATSSFRTDSALYAAGVRVCTPAFNRALGSSASRRALSAYSASFFIPTDAQREAGDRWIRCDLTLLGGKRLLNLPTDREPALGSGPLRSSIARCLQVTGKSFLATACTGTHNYRAKGTVAVSGTAYPSDSRFLRVAKERCPRVAGSRWYATWPSKAQWVQGKERLLVCHVRT